MGNTHSKEKAPITPPSNNTSPSASPVSATAGNSGSTETQSNTPHSVTCSDSGSHKKRVAIAEGPPLPYEAASRFVTAHAGNSKGVRKKFQNSITAIQAQATVISECFNRYKFLEQMLATKLGSKEASELMPPEDQKFVESVCSKEPIRIAFFGPTGAGKSTLINSLFKCYILPARSGHCTARVCVLKYAKPEDACIRSAKVVDGRIVPGEILESLTKFCTDKPPPNDGNEAPPKRAGEALGSPPETAGGKLFPFLDRSSLFRGDENEERKREILTTIIVVEYPVPLLKAGIELVDLPGHAKSDQFRKPISQFMPVFLGAYRPHGVVFCFTTAAFELNEQHALTSLEKLLFQASKGLSVEESIPEVFFANTSVDHRKIVADLHGDRPTEAAITRVYGEHLKQMLQSPATRWFNIPKDFATCTSFCCVSALDSLFQDPFRKFTHGLFMNKFLHWIIAAQQRQCCQALEQISAASGTFFNNLAVLCSTGDLETKRDVATERIEAAQVIILARITECTKALPELLEQKVREFKDEFLKKAISLPLEYNPRSITSKTEQAQSEITKKLGAWLTVKVVHPVITEMRKKIQDDVKTECQKIMEIEDNDVRKLLLGAAPTYNHKMHRLAQGGAVGLTGLGFVACLAAVAAVPLTGGASAALAVALGLSMCSLLGITGAGVLSAMDGLANADFNKIVAQHMLDSLCDRTKVEKQRQELEEVCRERTTQYFQSYLDKVTVLCKQREKMKNIFGAGNTADVQDLRLLFGKLNAEALEKRCEILQERTVQTSASSWSSTETSTPACIAVPLCPNNSSSHVTPVDTGIPATTTTTTSSSSSVTTVANDHDSFLAWKTDALANDTSTSGEPIMTTPAVAETTTSTPASSTTVTTTSTTTTATTADLLPLEHSMNNNQTGTVKVDLRKRSKEYQSAFFENLYYWSQMAQCSTHVLKLQTVFRENPKVWCMVHPQFHFTLKTYLEKHISTMELSEALVIAKDIITTIMDLHLHGTVFSNLKLENVVVTTEGDKVITELVTFHADTGSKGRDISDDGNSCTSIRGINVNPLSCSPKVDIFAFGVILSELTPKPTLLRCHITATGIVMATAPNTKPQLVNLINQCVTTKLNQRPAAWQVLESLNKILCMLENRSAGQNLGTGNSN